MTARRTILQGDGSVAKTKQPPSKGAAPNKSSGLYITIGAIALLVVAAIGFFATRGGSAATMPDTRLLDPTEIQQAKGVPMGQENAPVLIMEFADFQCPACGQYVTFSHPLIK